MKKSTVIATTFLLVTFCWSSILLIACRKEGIVSGPAGSNTVVHEMQAVPFDDSALQQEIAALKARNAALENEKAAGDFDKTALQSELDKERSRSASLEERVNQLEGQNRTLQEENGTLNDKVVLLNQTIADNGAAHQAETGMLNERAAQLSQSLDEKDAAYQEEIARLNQALAEKDAAYQEAQRQLAEQGNAPVSVAQADDSGKEGSASDSKAAAASSTRIEGQARNVLGFKVGSDLVDIEGTLAIMPHWFLIASMGLVETPEDFVEDKFPGHESNHNLFSGKYNFFYNILAGTGFNWRFNSLPAQPNFYISTMLGPSWFLYKDDGDLTSKTYLLWRSSVGFDLTLYKNFLFTGDVSFDWWKDYDFTPRVALGVLWQPSPKWSLFGKK